MKLVVGFKGQRNYIQGGDIFNALTEVVASLVQDEAAFVSWLAFRTFARASCSVMTEPPAVGDKLIAQARIEVDDPARQGQKLFIPVWVIEDPEPIDDRRPFDEEKLLAPAILDVENKSCTLLQRSIYTPIEDLIALTKHLHNVLYPEIDGKWLFAQLDLEIPLGNAYRQAAVILKSVVTGRFSVSDIVIDGRNIGTIRFIVGKP